MYRKNRVDDSSMLTSVMYLAILQCIISFTSVAEFLFNANAIDENTMTIKILNL